MMDAVREAGWTRFKPVKGQPIAEKDMRKIFKLVDLDKDGSISNLVKEFAVNIKNFNILSSSRSPPWSRSRSRP